VSVLAANGVRPDAVNFPLFLHVLGAMTMFGSLILATTALAGGARPGAEALRRLGFRALLWATIPAWFVMRIAAEWVADKEGWTKVDKDPAWIGIGYMTAEPGLLLLIVATVLASLGARRARDGGDGGGVQVRVALGLVSLLLLVYLVAIWAMTTKPT
jgi:hypothetical protein